MTKSQAMEFVDDEMMLDGLTDSEIEMMLEEMYFNSLRRDR